MSHLDYKKKAKKDLKKEEVFIIRQKLEKITKSGEQVTIDGEHGQALDLLERLGDIAMNFAILKETMIGFTVHALKKSSSDEEIILKSKTLIKTWKKLVPAKEDTRDKKETSDKKVTSDKTNDKSTSDKKDTSDKKESSSSSPKSKDSNEKPRKGTFKGNNGFYEYDGTALFEDEQCRKRDGYTEKLPKRNTDGVTLIFSDAEEFRPNMTPKEVLQAGSFGGTYFRPIKSSVTNLKYNKMWDELPQNWLEGISVKRLISSTHYDEKVNTYKAKCGGSLEMWETSGWIDKIDPYGWFMWYCRFYLGRRSRDDERQIGRWKNCTGPKGRWKNNLIGKIAKAGVKYNNSAISPVIRQTLQHWAYKLTEKDYLERKKQIKT